MGFQLNTQDNITRSMQCKKQSTTSLSKERMTDYLSMSGNSPLILVTSLISNYFFLRDDIKPFWTAHCCPMYYINSISKYRLCAAIDTYLCSFITAIYTCNLVEVRQQLITLLSFSQTTSKKTCCVFYP